MIEAVWTNKKYSDMTSEQIKLKEAKDKEYKQNVDDIYAEPGLSPEEKQSGKAWLWEEYSDWAKSAGIWKEVITTSEVI